MLAVGLVVYGIAAARTYFDEDEANKVLEREKGKRRKALEAGRLDPRGLSEPIARLLTAGHRREARIRDAIERAELPYDEVSAEVDRFIRAMEDGARRAQLLYEALAETPPAWVERRLGEVRGDPSKAELTSALENQLAVLRRDGDPAAALLRRDGARAGGARHGARQPGLGVGLHRGRQPGRLAGECARCARRWAPWPPG